MEFSGITQGEPHGIVLMFNIGVEYTEAGFALLKKDSAPQTCAVTCWPGMEAQAQTRRVPTKMWYNNDGQMVLAGAETLTPQARENAEDNGWHLVQQFPLHFHSMSCPVLNPLPPRVSLSAAYTDYFAYIIRNTILYFMDRVVNATALWNLHCNNLRVVLVHPECWSTPEQAFLQSCFKKAQPAGTECTLHGIAEGEALTMGSIHDLNLPYITKSYVLVCHVKEWSTEVATYEVSKGAFAHRVERQMFSYTEPGAQSIPARCQKFLDEKLGQIGIPKEDLNEYIDKGVMNFKSSVMPYFTGGEQDHRIQIAGTRFNNDAIKTRRGTMTLSSASIKSFFEPWMSALLEEIERHKKYFEIQHVIMMGESSDGYYSMERMSKILGQLNCQVHADICNNYVLQGAVIYGEYGIPNTTPRFSLGILVDERYDCSNREHHGRKIYRAHGGYGVIADRWSEIVKAGTDIDPTQPIRRQIVRALDTHRGQIQARGRFVYDLWAFSGKMDVPNWVKDEDGCINSGFSMVGTVEADLGAYGLNSSNHDVSSIDDFMVFLTIRPNYPRLEAYIEWGKKGVMTSGPTLII